MKHSDVTMIANGTQLNEAMVATKEGLHGGFATLRFPANHSLKYLALTYSLQARLDQRGRLPPLFEGRIDLGFQVDRLGDADRYASHLVLSPDKVLWWSPVA